MGSSVSWWNFAIVANCLRKWRKWNLWKETHHARKIWVSWNRLMRTLWSSGRTSVTFCTWESKIQECSTGWELPAWEQLFGKGPGAPGGLSSMGVTCVLLQHRKGADPGWLQQGLHQQRWSSFSHPTRCLPGHTWSAVLSFVPCAQHRCGQAGEGPEEDTKAVTGLGNLGWEEWLRELDFFSLEKKKVWGRPYPHVFEGWLQRRWRFTRNHMGRRRSNE